MLASHFYRSFHKGSFVRRSSEPACRAFSKASGSGDSNNSEKSDLQLHRAYRGFLPRFEAARALLFTQEGEEKFEMYVEANIGGGFVSKMLVLTDLEHPLFLKYKFDAKDFMQGTKHAFERLTGEVLHSAEFREHALTHAWGKRTMTDDDEDESEHVKPAAGEDSESEQEILPENISHPGATASGNADCGEEGPVQLLRSVCTEEAFQDFVNITAKEVAMKDKFVITNEEIDSFYLSRAFVRVEQNDMTDMTDEFDKRVDEDDSGDGDHSGTVTASSTGTHVFADIVVKFITMCDISLPLRGGAAEKKWKMMRVFNWKFSGEISCGRDELEWRISEVGASGWD